MYKLKIYFTVFLAVICYAAQSQSPTQKIEFKIQSFRDNNRVILRWAFNNAAQWRYVNTLGVNIERADDNSGKFKKINKAVIRPINTKEEFLKLDTNGYTYRGMLSIFNVPGKESKGDMDYQQYAMYYILTSYEIESAVLTGSAFIDSSVEAGKKYTYRITVANTKVPQINNSFFVSDKNTDLPKSPAITPVFSNRSVSLAWDTKDVKDDYFASVLERSTDSIHFEKIGQPIIKVSSPEEKPEDETKINVVDSIPNKIKFYYRIRGLNTFGELGKPGDVISGKAYPDLNVSPFITGVDSTAPGKLTIQWELADSLFDATAKYEIYQSKRFDTNYVKIGEVVGAAANKKEFSFTSKSLSTYFKVKAIGNRYNQTTESEPFLYQLIDSIPPAIPVGLKGSVDSTGVVTLKWEKNTEMDFLGYRVLRAQKKEDEFVILNATPQNITSFKDTLPMNQLNTVMYYKIAAVDARYNESAPTAYIEVKRPDLIPPAPPRMDSVKIRDNKIYIQWVKSFSKDVSGYIIYKKASTDTTKTWRQLISVKSQDTSYTDADVQPGATYYYSVQAVDEGNLKSAISDPKSVYIEKAATALKGVKNIAPYVARQYKYIELSWQNNEPEANQYWVYRSSPGEELALVKVLPANIKRYVDEDVKNGATYKYAIKVVYKNGKSSKMERVEVAY
ncbi:MAG: fibronectin type III domain-containing protein [Sphingobacteriia bacterium]|nr:fibronectin type III domain-containing protein [Sphingobacteriia bacterium]